MNRLAAAQGNDPVRSLLEIEADILAQKRTIGRSIVVIGQALIEAKAQLAHGEWGPWLRERVNFGQSTADNYMRIAEQVGSESRLLDLPYTKILALLSVPEGEREEFADANRVEDRSVSEIKRLIAERDAAKAQSEKDQAYFNKLMKLNDRKDNEIMALEKKLAAEQRRTEELMKREPDTVTVEKEVPPADYEAVKTALADAREIIDMVEQERDNAIEERDRALEELEAEKICGAPDPLDIAPFCEACAQLLNRLVAAPVAGGLFRTKTDAELERYERNVGLVMEWAVRTQDVLLEIRTERSGGGFVFELP